MSRDLKDAGINPREDRGGRDALERFLEVPNYAMFLFTSEDVVLDRYIREHWDALDGLSGDICDIHVSLLQLHGQEDAYTQLSDVKTIRGLADISLDILPALHVWSDFASITFSLKGASVHLDKLRDAFRSIFSAMHKLKGPITQEWVVRMHSWDCGANNSASVAAQSISGSIAGRDIVQVLHFHNFNSHAPGAIMPNAIDKPTSEGRSTQSMEDVRAGKNASQSSETANDNQSMRGVQAAEDVSQAKRKTSEMSFLGGKAGGWGIVGLVIVIVAWLAYKAFAKT